nr:asparagine synthase-related protein [Haloplanus ruber]
MLEAIDHRGPDGCASWCDDHVALGHQQFQTTPQSALDDQPYRDGDTVVSADARIDNRHELLSKLTISEPAEQISDSELIAAAYRRWGNQCAEHLVGAFAFVIFDLDAGTLFCARDHVGVRPLYYYRADDVFAAASEIKALLSLPFIPTESDPERIGDFLVGRFGDKQNTIHQSVRRLPPAHTLQLSATGRSMERYWKPALDTPLRLESDAAYETRFRELFTEAVRCRLRTSGDAGVELSGGLDSSSVTAVARELVPDHETLHSISNVFDDTPGSDERAYIDVMADQDGISPWYVQTDGVSILVDRDDLVSCFDQPLHHPAHFTGWERAKQADEIGLDVLLTGLMGDAAGGQGLGVFLYLFRTGHWLQLYDELKTTSETWNGKKTDIFYNQVIKRLVPDGLVRTLQQIRGNPVLEERANPAIDPDFAERIALRSRYKTLNVADRSLRPNYRRQHYTSIMIGMFTEALEVCNQRDAAFGIESRHPYTDRRLLEFLIKLPPTQQFSEGRPRSIVRRSLHDVLPEEIRSRLQKTTMDDAVRNALAREDEAISRMLDAPGVIAQYHDMDVLRSTYERFNTERDGGDVRVLWRALALWTWLNTQ